MPVDLQRRVDVRENMRRMRTRKRSGGERPFEAWLKKSEVDRISKIGGGDLSQGVRKLLSAYVGKASKEKYILDNLILAYQTKELLNSNQK